MILFDNNKRTDFGSKLFEEPSFRYLNRSSRPEAYRIRKVVEDWFIKYPDEHKLDLRGRIRSGDDYNHLSAFFELFLHNLHSLMGCKVQIHPMLSHTTRRPDFLITDQSGFQYYLEAKVVMGETVKKSKDRARIYQMLDRVNEGITASEFSVGVVIKKWPQQSLPSKEIIQFLKKEFGEKKINDISKNNESPLQTINWENSDSILAFHLIPKLKEKIDENKNLKSIIFSSEPVEMFNTSGDIRKSIKEKCSRYGKIDKPYVIAINSMMISVNMETLMEALFGDDEFTINLSDQDSFVESVRTKNNGAWGIIQQNPNNTRNSAIFFTKRLSPWNLSNNSEMIIHNPWASKVYNSVLNMFPQIHINNSFIEKKPGESINNLFTLPVGWPEVESDFD